MFIALVSSLLVGLAASAADCSRELRDENVNTILEKFPTGVVRRVFDDPLEFARHDRELDRDAKPFWDALAAARSTHSAPDHNYLPMTFSAWQQGGIRYLRHLAWDDLHGRTVVGFTRNFEFANFQDGGATERLAEVEFFAGVVTDVEWHSRARDVVTLTIIDVRGETEEIELTAALDETLVDARLYQILPKVTDEQYLRSALDLAEFESQMEIAFGSPLEPEDWNIAAAAVETAVRVPATFGPSAVLKILLGRQVKGGETYPAYGIARGKRRYSQKPLSAFVGRLSVFLEAMGILGPERRSEILARESDREEGGFPEWLGHRPPSALGPKFVAIWKTLAAQKGVGAIGRVAAKPKAADRLTKANAKARLVLEVQEEIGVRSAGEGLEAVRIWDPDTQRLRFTAKPGDRLRITRPPHRVGPAAMVIGVKKEDGGEEGVAWYTELKASTKIVADEI